LLKGDLLPTRSQAGLIVSFSEASAVARCLGQRMMPGSFFTVV
jgi:hypothetical protein